MTTTSPPQIRSRAAAARANPVVRLLARRETGVALIFLVTAGAVAFRDPSFLAPENLRDLLISAAPSVIVGVAMTLVIVTGEIDISVGSLSGLVAAVMGLCASRDHLGWSTPAAVTVALGVGTAVGALNGILIAYLRIPSIITTLAMYTALRSATNKIVGGEWIQNLPDSLRFLGTGYIAHVHVAILTAVVVFAAGVFLTYYTPLGRRIYAVGSNPVAAPLAGLSPRRIKFIVFTLTGLLTAVATLVSVTQLSTIDAGFGNGLELFVITAVVVGGTSISGGKGTLAGMLLGVLLLRSIRTMLIFLKLGPQAAYWENAIQGAFILIAVLVDHLATRRGSAAH